MHTLAPLAIATLLTPALAAANTGFGDQQDYTVTILPGSDLSFATGYSGANVTGYSIDGLGGYLLTVGPGGWASLTPQLRASFQADPGRIFTRVDWAVAVDVATTEGSGYFAMSWGVAGGAPASGSTPVWTNQTWHYNGTQTLNSPAVGLAARRFELDVGSYLAAAGYPGGCSGALGQCASVGGPFVKVWVETAAAPVPEPAAWAMLLAGLGLVALGRRRGVPMEA
jgi:hypothetical protein